MSTDNESRNDSSWIIKLRGLPWTVTSKDILMFLDDVDVVNGENGVHLITYSRNHTRPNGEAFVECASAEDYKKAFKFDKKTMGHRYIEIFSAKQEDFETIMRKQNIVKHDTVVKLRGLPWGVTEKEIEHFFDGLELNQDTGIHIQLDRSGRASGEAFVQFETEDDCEKALKRNLEKIGHRYIEIFRSSSSELRRAMSQQFGNNRATPYDRNGRGDRGNRGSNSMNNMNNMRSLRGSNNDRRNARDLFDSWDNRGNNFNDNFNENFNNDNLNRSSYNNGFNGNFGGGNFGNNGGGGNFGSNGGGNFGNNGGCGNFGNNGGGFGNNGGGIFGNNLGGGNFGNTGGGGSGGGSGSGFGNNNGFNNGSGFNSPGGFNGGGNFGNGLSSGNNNGGGGGGGFGNNFGSNNSGSGGGGNLFGGNGNNSGNRNNGGGNGYGALNTLGFGGGMNNMGRNFGNSGNNNNGGFGSNNFGGNNNSNDFDAERDGFCVHLRGMPYYCDDMDIYKFFAPLKPGHAKVIYNNKGMHSGGGNVYFLSHDDAMQAMKKDKEKMGSRYIELFYDSPMSNNNRRSKRF